MNPPAPAESTLSKRLMPGAFPSEATSPRVLTGVPRMSPRNTHEYWRVLRERDVAAVADPAGAAVADGREEAEVDVAVPGQRGGALVPLFFVALQCVRSARRFDRRASPRRAFQARRRRRWLREATAPEASLPAQAPPAPAARGPRRAATTKAGARSDGLWGTGLALVVRSSILLGQVDERRADRSSVIRKSSITTCCVSNETTGAAGVAPGWNENAPSRQLSIGASPSRICRSATFLAHAARRPGGEAPGADALASRPLTRRTVPTPWRDEMTSAPVFRCARISSSTSGKPNVPRSPVKRAVPRFRVRRR